MANIVGLPAGIENALGRYDARKAELELAEKRAQLVVAGPRLEVSYLILENNLRLRREREEALSSQEAITLVSFPETRNEVLEALGGADPLRYETGCGLGAAFAPLSVAYLVIENRGRRDAAEISVSVDRLALTKPVKVREAAAGGDDYVAKLRSAARQEPTEVRVPIPRSLAPGAGIRLPLWVQAPRENSSNPWCVVSAVALQPKSVAFADPVLESTKSFPVRRLASPVLYESGALGRG